ncbi:hypothetical protein HKD37_07G018292 [Glycine soja]
MADVVRRRPTSFNCAFRGTEVTFNVLYIQELNMAIETDPLHALDTFIYIVLLTFLQIRYQDDGPTPFHVHPKIIYVSIFSFLVYCLAFWGRRQKYAIPIVRVHHFETLMLMFGSLSMISLVLMLLPNTWELFGGFIMYPIWFIIHVLTIINSTRFREMLAHRPRFGRIFRKPYTPFQVHPKTISIAIASFLAYSLAFLGRLKFATTIRVHHFDTLMHISLALMLLPETLESFGFIVYTLWFFTHVDKGATATSTKEEGGFLQIKYPENPTPFQLHPKTIWLSIASFLAYCFAFLARLKFAITISVRDHFDTLMHVFGSLSLLSLVLLLLPDTWESFGFIMYTLWFITHVLPMMIRTRFMEIWLQRQQMRRVMHPVLPMTMMDLN